MCPSSTLKNCGQLVDRQPADGPADRRDARIVADLEDGSLVHVLVDVLEPPVVGVPVHGAELQHPERLAAPSDPLLHVEDRTARRGRRPRSRPPATAASTRRARDRSSAMSMPRLTASCHRAAFNSPRRFAGACSATRNSTIEGSIAPMSRSMSSVVGSSRISWSIVSTSPCSSGPSSYEPTA